jgi:hypothetical protein
MLVERRHLLELIMATRFWIFVVTILPNLEKTLMGKDGELLSILVNY